jgi:hypothetical protein
LLGPAEHLILLHFLWRAGVSATTFRGTCTSGSNTDIRMRPWIFFRLQHGWLPHLRGTVSRPTGDCYMQVTCSFSTAIRVKIENINQLEEIKANLLKVTTLTRRVALGKCSQARPIACDYPPTSVCAKKHLSTNKLQSVQPVLLKSCKKRLDTKWQSSIAKFCRARFMMSGYPLISVRTHQVLSTNRLGFCWR